MASNATYFPAHVVPVSTPYAGGVASGDGVLVGAIFGVAQRAAAQNEMVDVAVVGVYALPKATGAISAGARVFWNDTARNVTTTATGNYNIGYAMSAAGASDTTVSVLLGRGAPAGT